MPTTAWRVTNARGSVSSSSAPKDALGNLSGGERVEVVRLAMKAVGWRA